MRQMTEDEAEDYRVEAAIARRHRLHHSSCATPYCAGGLRQRCMECDGWNGSCACGACNETCSCATSGDDEEE